MSHSFKVPVTIFGYCVSKNTIKTKCNLKNNKYDRNRLTNNFVETQHVFSIRQVILTNAASLPDTCDDFLGGFWLQKS